MIFVADHSDLNMILRNGQHYNLKVSVEFKS